MVVSVSENKGEMMTHNIEKRINKLKLLEIQNLKIRFRYSLFTQEI